MYNFELKKAEFHLLQKCMNGCIVDAQSDLNRWWKSERTDTGDLDVYKKRVDALRILSLRIRLQKKKQETNGDIERYFAAKEQEEKGLCEDLGEMGDSLGVHRIKFDGRLKLVYKGMSFSLSREQSINYLAMCENKQLTDLEILSLFRGKDNED